MTLALALPPNERATGEAREPRSCTLFRRSLGNVPRGAFAAHGRAKITIYLKHASAPLGATVEMLGRAAGLLSRLTRYCPTVAWPTEAGAPQGPSCGSGLVLKG